jgi:integral membrane sensor domain MASE1
MQYFLNKKFIFTALILSIAYIFLGILSIKYVTMSSGIVIAWLPNSILLAFFLSTQIKKWKYYVPFFILAEIVADYGTFTTIQALEFSLINLFETMLGAYLIKKISKYEKVNFTSTKYVITFFLISANAMPALSAFLGAIVYYTQIDSSTTLFEFWRVWYFGDAIGVLLLTPIFIILKENYKSLKNYLFSIENIAIVGLIIFLALELFSFDNMDFVIPVTPLIFILLILWVVYRQGLIPALFLAFFVSIVAIYNTSNEMGPFTVFSIRENTIYLQEFIALLLIITLFFGVLNKEVDDSREELLELNKTLEKQVQAKTKSLLEANKKLKNLASKDSLTNIFNRRIVTSGVKIGSMKAA